MLPIAAFAHTGHEHSTFMSGVLHPLTGVDHLLAMLAVGLWAASFRGAVRWAMPALFIIVMVFGFIIGHAGGTLPHLEQTIAASVLVLGVLVALAKPAPVWFAATLVSGFALFHGVAHGFELGLGSPWQYVLGFSLSTCLLLSLGLAIAYLYKPHTWIIRLTGVLMGLIGVLLIVA